MKNKIDICGDMPSYYEDLAAHVLGYTLRLLGNWPEAEISFRRMTEAAPNDVDGWLELAICLMAQDKSNGAVIAANKAVQVSPDSVIPWAGLAEILNRVGAKEEAEKAISRAYEINPTSERLKFIFENFNDYRGFVYYDPR